MFTTLEALAIDLVFWPYSSKHSINYPAQFSYFVAANYPFQATSLYLATCSSLCELSFHQYESRTPKIYS